MKALIVIDMQLGSFRPYTVRHDAYGVIERINRLSDYFRKQNLPVIFIRHDGTKENAFIPGTEEWKLLPELTVSTGDIFISKTANDAFYSSGLQRVLSEMKIEELYFTGCATDFCVDSTIKSALTKDYRITVVSDAHTTAGRPYVAAGILIAQYNWMWADMTPTKHRIRVQTTDDLLVKSGRPAQ